MRDEQRWLLALALSMAILFGWQAMMAPRTPRPAPQAPVVVPPVAAPSAAAPAAGRTQATATPEAALPQAAAAGAQTTAAVAMFIPVTVANDDMALTVSGATVVAWTQRGYRTDMNGDGGEMDLCREQPAPCLRFGFADLGVPHAVEPLGEPGQGVRALWRSGGAVLSAELRPAPNHRVQIAFGAAGDTQGVRFKPFVQMGYRPPAKKTAYVFTGLRVRRGGELESLDLDDLQDERLWQGRFEWLMWDRKYFSRAVFPPEQEVTARIARSGEGEQAAAQLWLTGATRTLGVDPTPAVEFTVFGGPKDMALLQRVGSGLYQAIDYGWTGFAARPMLALLHVFHNLVGNYGWAIVLLTVVIKIALYPLTKKSYLSMAAMSKLKPKMEELQKKFKQDPQRLNQEMLSLYRTEKVNPLGGCLPMLVQIPIFFALYNVLLISIELRHAPWGLWVTDLSAPDTLLTLSVANLNIAIRVLPLVMGITMLAQQKLMPAQVDPMQQKIFMLMPIMFTFVSYGFPSGLVLYWLTNNVVSIGQQRWIQRQMQKKAST